MNCMKPTIAFFRLFLLPLLVLVLATSCSSLRTQSSDSCAKISGDTVISYYLPKPYVQVELYEENFGADKTRVHVRMLGISSADVSKSYLLKLNHNWGSRDEVRAVLTPEGLLSHITYDRHPRQADAVVVIGRAALKAASMVVGGPFKGDGAPPEFARLVARGLYPYTGNCMTTNLHMGNREFTVKITQDSKTNAPRLSCDEMKREAFRYRRLIPLTVTICDKDRGNASGSPIDITGIVYVPDPCPANDMSYPLTHLTFAHQRYDFAFAGGVLSEVAVRKESELLTIAEIPGNILGVVTGLPAKLISVEVNHNNSPSAPGATSFGDDKDPGRSHSNQEKTGY